MENNLFYVSSSPHTRSPKTTQTVMRDVIIGLMPATLMGVYVHGLKGLIVILSSVIAAVLGEFLFDKAVGKKNTVTDLSAVVTGLLLALCLPEGVGPIIPALGAVFAVVVVKGLFGGLGKNFMNPALAARGFLLISFSTAMTTYGVDGITSATPLADLAAGKAIDVWSVFLGTSNGVIGSSTLGLLIGGIYLLATHTITLHIPAASIISFALFMFIAGGRIDPEFLLVNIAGGGIIMAAVFMATDYVTSPVSTTGQVVYGVLVGVLGALFHIYGNATDSASFSVIIANLFVPLIDEYIVPKPFGHRGEKENDTKGKKSALTLCAITLIAGLALSGIFAATKDAIQFQKDEAAKASYVEVCPNAVTFEDELGMTTAIKALEGNQYGTEFGRVFINKAYSGKDETGIVKGYVLSVTTKDGYDGSITLTMGLSTEGEITGIAFTELHETAGMGMRVDEPDFKGQFNGRKAARFKLDKTGAASAEDEINSVSGASISSTAVLNAINAALDFYANNAK